jgi:hypothetical protein
MTAPIEITTPIAERDVAASTHQNLGFGRGIGIGYCHSVSASVLKLKPVVFGFAPLVI